MIKKERNLKNVVTNMIDLHTHTNHSDGMLTVNELIDNAVENKVKILSITDHDTISGVIEYSKNINDSIIVIPGIEFSTDTYYLGRKTKIHMLGYGYNLNDERINNMLLLMHKRHYDDNKEYIEELIPKFSYLSSEFFANFNFIKGGWLYKHILKCVEEYLSTEQLNELREYMINNKPNYNRYNEAVEDVIKLMNSCNGYTVFAHPQKCDVTKDELASLVRYLANLGLSGLETYHIDSNPNDRKFIHGLALKYSLYETGGSDFHSFQYGKGVGDKKINFPEDYDPQLVKRMIKEKKILGVSDE